MRVSRRLALLFVCAVLLPATTAAGSLPAGWAAGDIGRPALRGSVALGRESVTISGAGSDVWGTQDQFMFVHRRLTGDGTIVARVVSLQAVDAWSKAGIMMRESLDPGARHAFALVSRGRGAAFQRRVSTKRSSVHTGVSGAAPVWLRLQRQGSRFVAARSTDGVRWTTIGTQTLAMPATIYVGLAVTSHRPAVRARAVFSSVAVTTPRAVALPAGWGSADIGGARRAGSVMYVSDTITVRGGGSDIWGTADQFRFLYRQASGDVDVVARVASVENVDPWTKAGIMIRRSLTAGSAHASLFVSPLRGVAFQRRPRDGASSVHTGAGGRTAPWWLKLSRRGSAITAYQSADGVRWSFVGVETISLQSTFYVGVAVTSHDAAAVARAVFSGVTVRKAPPPPGGHHSFTNRPPTVTFASPAGGAAVVAPGSIPLQATATDTDGTVSRVDFYAGNTLIGSDTVAPYSVSWKAARAGTYPLLAVARDNAGGTTVSATRTLTVADRAVPRRAVFVPSSDHATAVDRYVVEFFRAGSNPAVSNPVALTDIGKPPVVNGECQADISATIASLPAGTYVATVTAVGFGGAARSAPSPQFTIALERD